MIPDSYTNTTKQWNRETQSVDHVTETHYLTEQEKQIIAFIGSFTEPVSRTALLRKFQHRRVRVADLNAFVRKTAWQGVLSITWRRAKRKRIPFYSLEGRAAEWLGLTYLTTPTGVKCPACGGHGWDYDYAVQPDGWLLWRCLRCRRHWLHNGYGTLRPELAA